MFAYARLWLPIAVKLLTSEVLAARHALEHAARPRVGVLQRKVLRAAETADDEAVSKQPRASRLLVELELQDVGVRVAVHPLERRLALLRRAQSRFAAAVLALQEAAREQKPVDEARQAEAMLLQPLLGQYRCVLWQPGRRSATCACNTRPKGICAWLRCQIPC